VAKYISDALFIRHEANHYKHVTTEAELKGLLKKIKDIKATFEVKACLKLAILTFARPSEVAGLKWSEVNIEENYIEKEQGAMKQRRSFIIPLSRQSLMILDMLRPVTGHTDFVFYSPYGTGKPISTASLTNALRRNGIDEVSPHGFRHTASTALNELGFNADEIELQLSHVIQGVRGVYNKAEKLKQRFTLMQAWADHLDRLSG
jgi:integrase